MNMKLNLLGVLLWFVMAASSALGADYISYEPQSGPGLNKHVVLLSGDEEYRSEEGLPMLAKILSQKHGFRCTVLFSVDADGTINPDKSDSLSHSEALDSADAIVMLLRFRRWSDDVMKRFETAVQRGIPIIGLRTSTHAFSGLKGTYAHYNNFGKDVLGERWVSHWGVHKKEACRGIVEPGAESHPLLRGVSDVFADSDVYEAAPPADAKIIMRGQVLKGMSPNDPPADYRKKRSGSKDEQGINDPMMPVVWTREFKHPTDKTSRVLCTTMGAATDLQSEGLRRLVVNGVYWGLGLDVPAKANVDYVDPYQPTMYGFRSYRKGLTAADHKLGKVLPQ